jgi:hypothetical protein
MLELRKCLSVELFGAMNGIRCELNGIYVGFMPDLMRIDGVRGVGWDFAIKIQGFECNFDYL